ncbi:MAG: pimeloyl-ACP methyl esterase BioG family protein [Candidatus Cryptobacteroides sp.]
MKQEFLKKNGTKALLLLFGGWGSAPKLFRDSVEGCGRDCLFCYDYKDCSFDFSLLEGYEDIKLVAWSMGVWGAGQVFNGFARDYEDNKYIEHQGFVGRITDAVAIGGTPTPIDDLYGIPTAVFDATLDKMSPMVLYKFRRRMCGADLAIFESRMPDRNVDDLREELAAIRNMVSEGCGSDFLWRRAYVCEEDLIFPTANQIRAWEKENVPVGLRDGAHYSAKLFDEICSSEPQLKG